MVIVNGNGTENVLSMFKTIDKTYVFGNSIMNPMNGKDISLNVDVILKKIKNKNILYYFLKPEELVNWRSYDNSFSESVRLWVYQFWKHSEYKGGKAVNYISKIGYSALLDAS